MSLTINAIYKLNNKGFTSRSKDVKKLTTPQTEAVLTVPGLHVMRFAASGGNFKGNSYKVVGWVKH